MQVNLRYGVRHDMSRTGAEKDTCTACAGSMLLEFSALSRMTGNTVFEVHLTLVLPHCDCLLHTELTAFLPVPCRCAISMTVHLHADIYQQEA